MYHYWKIKLKLIDQREQNILATIKDIITLHKERAGYRTVIDELHVMGYTVNHKKVLRIMKENNLLCTKYKHRNKNYKSYKGKIGKVAKNKLNRRFISDRPDQKLLTDVTQFNIKNGSMKVYFSPVFDVSSKEIIAYSISKSPSLEFVMKSLVDTLKALPDLTYRTTIHSDQGWHYQHKSWIETLNKNKVIQSMSRKGNCLDNSPMENFFGLMKQEMFYGEDFKSFEALEAEIKEYVYYYNNVRKKRKLKSKTPVEYRNLAFEKLD